jgi:hypothetical protein
MNPETSTTRPGWHTGLEITGFILVALAMACAMYFSGWSMWHVIEDKFQVTGRPELIIPMFALFDLAGAACAVLATWSLLSAGRRGAAYPLLWVFVALSGLMSATDGTNFTSRVMRFAAPMVAAALFELLLSIKQRHVTGRDGFLLRVTQPVLARLGWLDPHKTNTAAARAAAVGKLATRAYALHQLPVGTRRRKVAERKYLRKIRAAVERFGIATDDDMIQAVRAGVAALHGAVEQTSPESVRDANPWVRKVRAEVQAKVPPQPVPRSAPAAPQAKPAPKRPSIPAHGSGNGRSRRTAAETRALHAQLKVMQPGLTQGEYAAALGISTRALRDALNAAKEAA